jgi:UPF0176 protein
MNYRVITFYHFTPIPAERLETLRQQLKEKARPLGVRGLMILGSEGVNATLSGSDDGIETFRHSLIQLLNLQELPAKESRSPRHPFKHFKCKVREEIVTTRDLTIDPNSIKGTSLSPEEWHRTLQEEDVVVLDTRNWYESKIGKFRGAVDPHIDQFTDFPGYIAQSDLAKDQKILIYCTGGIRCEKAIVEMNRQGYENVRQLDGGILNYLKAYPDGNFEGECFVFDYRVAVDHNLDPTQRYRLCPHCGQPGDVHIECRQCSDDGVICESCQAHDDRLTCSKNCAHHLRMGHRSRRKEQKSQRFASRPNPLKMATKKELSRNE